MTKGEGRGVRGREGRLGRKGRKRGEGRGVEGLWLTACVCFVCRGHAAFNTAIQMLDNNSVIGGGSAKTGG